MTREKRKLDHIDHALQTGASGGAGFEDIQFIHNCLPNTSLSSVSLHTALGELTMSSPFFINAMTGGGGNETERINTELAVVARNTGLAISVGSQMSAIKNKEEARTYKTVRKYHPEGIIFGNLGSEATVEQAEAAVDMLRADALQIHLNVVQELAMPEGDRSFTGALERIDAITRALSIPVIVKETGFGISGESAKLLQQAGVSVIDVGGYGGTNFSRIENMRQTQERSFFDEWGIPTVSSLAEVTSAVSVPVIASGGVRTSQDIVKSLALGAGAVGVAGRFLTVLMEEGASALEQEIQMQKEEISMMMTALGVRSITDLHHVPLMIKGDVYHWLTQRGLDPSRYARRKK